MITKLSYEISNRKQDIIEVKLQLDSDCIESFSFFVGKLEILHFQASLPYDYQANIIHTAPTNSLSFWYQVRIGQFKKHGKNGAAREEEYFFCGEQVFLFPTDLLTAEDEFDKKHINLLEITFDQEESLAVLPFPKGNHLELREFFWGHCFELMKSPYLILASKSYQMVAKERNLSLWNNHDTSLSPTTLEAIKDLFSYYCKLFSMPNHRIDLVFLPSDQYGQFAGCGKQVLAFDFSESKLRDWQLLSHRFFHSFMDTALPYHEFRMPTGIWLTEALATYYENYALQSLPPCLQTQLSFDYQKEVEYLYCKYLYLCILENSSFRFAALEQSHLQNSLYTEFMHYTHAPLILCLFSYQMNVPVDEILHYFTSHKPVLSVSDYFSTKKEYKEFYLQYVEDFNLLPLWDYLTKLSLSKPVLESLLLDYDSLLKTWGDFQRKGNLEQNSPNEILMRLRDYSPDLYEILSHL